MKWLLVLILPAFFFASCKTDDDYAQPVKPVKPTLDDLLLGNTSIYLPDDYHTKSYAVYVNEAGFEKKLKIDFEDGMHPDVSNNFPYNSEYIDIRLIDSTNSSYVIGVNLQSVYDYYVDPTNPRYLSICHIALFTFYNQGFIPTISLDSIGTLLFHQPPLPVINIAGREFHNAYENEHQPEGFDSYSSIYYSRELGVVGFETENGEMWALDRYEN